MTHTLPAPQDARPTVREMVEEVLDLGAGLAIIGLPLFALSLPGIALFFVFPALLLAAIAVPLAAVAAVLVAPVLLVRRLLRRPAAGYGSGRSSQVGGAAAT
jgi:hypothetical protein